MPVLQYQEVLYHIAHRSVHTFNPDIPILKGDLSQAIKFLVSKFGIFALSRLNDDICFVMASSDFIIDKTRTCTVKEPAQAPST
mmetsp:Transcript_46913/g.87433  ORF Transcript_46913/g.87433 Transcript_46913/m.87433 type:complete len:84 (-) Transcript_46913:162-413(-)